MSQSEKEVLSLEFAILIIVVRRLYAADRNSKSPQKGEAKVYHVRVR